MIVGRMMNNKNNIIAHSRTHGMTINLNEADTFRAITEQSSKAMSLLLILFEYSDRDNSTSLTRKQLVEISGHSIGTIGRSIATLKKYGIIYRRRVGNFQNLCINKKFAHNSGTNYIQNSASTDKAYLYLLSDSTNTKIGITENFNKRIQAYNTHNPKYKTYRVFECPIAEAKRIEAAIKAYYKDKLSGPSSEWFSVEAEEISVFASMLLGIGSR